MCERLWRCAQPHLTTFQRTVDQQQICSRFVDRADDTRFVDPKAQFLELVQYVVNRAMRRWRFHLPTPGPSPEEVGGRDQIDRE